MLELVISCGPGLGLKFTFFPPLLNQVWEVGGSRVAISNITTCK